MTLNPKRLGLAFAMSASVFYLGCTLLMGMIGASALTAFFNGILHGLDVAPIIVDSVSPLITITGFVNTFILSWLFGALIAVVYNLPAGFGEKKKK